MDFLFQENVERKFIWKIVWSTLYCMSRKKQHNIWTFYIIRWNTLERHDLSHSSLSRYLNSSVIN